MQIPAARSARGARAAGAGATLRPPSRRQRALLLLGAVLAGIGIENAGRWPPVANVSLLALQILLPIAWWVATASGEALAGPARERARAEIGARHCTRMKVVRQLWLRQVSAASWWLLPLSPALITLWLAHHHPSLVSLARLVLLVASPALVFAAAGLVISARAPDPATGRLRSVLAAASLLSAALVAIRFAPRKASSWLVPWHGEPRTGVIPEAAALALFALVTAGLSLGLLVLAARLLERSLACPPSSGLFANPATVGGVCGGGLLALALWAWLRGGTAQVLDADLATAVASTLAVLSWVLATLGAWRWWLRPGSDPATGTASATMRTLRSAIREGMRCSAPVLLCELAVLLILLAGHGGGPRPAAGLVAAVASLATAALCAGIGAVAGLAAGPGVSALPWALGACLTLGVGGELLSTAAGATMSALARSPLRNVLGLDAAAPYLLLHGLLETGVATLALIWPWGRGAGLFRPLLLPALIAAVWSIFDWVGHFPIATHLNPFLGGLPATYLLAESQVPLPASALAPAVVLAALLWWASTRREPPQPDASSAGP